MSDQPINPPDIIPRSQLVNDLDGRRIEGVAARILETLNVACFSPHFQFSVLTTAWVDQMKRMLRTSSKEDFDADRAMVLSLLQKLGNDIIGMKLPNESNSQDGPSDAGQDRTTH